MLRVQDVMSKDLDRVGAETPAENAWQQMRMRRVHHLVVSRGGRVVGIFSDRDAGGARGVSVRRGHSVGDLMTAKPVTVPPDTPIRKAANLMRGRSIGSLIVTDPRGGPLGIITTSDLLELIGRGVERITPETKRWTLKHRVPHTGRTSATGLW